MEKIPLCFHRQINDPTRRKDPASKLFLILVQGVTTPLEFLRLSMSLEKIRTCANREIYGVVFSLREQGFTARGELIIPANVKKIPLVFASENENWAVGVFAKVFWHALDFARNFCHGEGQILFRLLEALTS